MGSYECSEHLVLKYIFIIKHTCNTYMVKNNYDFHTEKIYVLALICHNSAL
jgi:hypothetical protein